MAYITQRYADEDDTIRWTYRSKDTLERFSIVLLISLVDATVRRELRIIGTVTSSPAKSYKCGWGDRLPAERATACLALTCHGSPYPAADDLPGTFTPR